MAEYTKAAPTVYAEKFDGTLNSAKAIWSLLKDNNISSSVELISKVYVADDVPRVSLVFRDESLTKYSVYPSEYVVVTVHTDGTVEYPQLVSEEDFEKQFTRKD